MPNPYPPLLSSPKSGDSYRDSIPFIWSLTDCHFIEIYLSSDLINWRNIATLQGIETQFNYKPSDIDLGKYLYAGVKVRGKNGYVSDMRTIGKFYVEYDSSAPIDVSPKIDCIELIFFSFINETISLVI
jgi:hypothetical protein